ncbi:hypothetical protein [Aurantivibrio infirmus]
MIPSKIEVLLANQAFNFNRSDVELAKLEMLKLGIEPSSEFFEFYKSVCVINLHSESSYEELSDVSEPSSQVAVGTNFVHEVWKVPSEFVCITTCEGEGCYLYSKKTRSVYDFSLSEREVFIKDPKPSWETFYDFIEWYLSPKKCVE